MCVLVLCAGTLLAQVFMSSHLAYAAITVNSEIFARILFSRKAIKDIFAMLRIRN